MTDATTIWQAITPNNFDDWYKQARTINNEPLANAVALLARRSLYEIVHYHKELKEARSDAPSSADNPVVTAFDHRKYVDDLCEKWHTVYEKRVPKFRNDPPIRDCELLDVPSMSDAQIFWEIVTPEDKSWENLIDGGNSVPTGFDGRPVGYCLHRQQEAGQAALIKLYEIAADLHRNKAMSAETYYGYCYPRNCDLVITEKDPYPTARFLSTVPFPCIIPFNTILEERPVIQVPAPEGPVGEVVAQDAPVSTPEGQVREDTATAGQVDEGTAASAGVSVGSVIEEKPGDKADTSKDVPVFVVEDELVDGDGSEVHTQFPAEEKATTGLPPVPGSIARRHTTKPPVVHQEYDTRDIDVPHCFEVDHTQIGPYFHMQRVHGDQNSWVHCNFTEKNIEALLVEGNWDSGIMISALILVALNYKQTLEPGAPLEQEIVFLPTISQDRHFDQSEVEETERQMHVTLEHMKRNGSDRGIGLWQHDQHWGVYEFHAKDFTITLKHSLKGHVKYQKALDLFKGVVRHVFDVSKFPNNHLRFDENSLWMGDADKDKNAILICGPVAIAELYKSVMGHHEAGVATAFVKEKVDSEREVVWFPLKLQLLRYLCNQSLAMVDCGVLQQCSMKGTGGSVVAYGGENHMKNMYEWTVWQLNLKDLAALKQWSVGVAKPSKKPTLKAKIQDLQGELDEAEEESNETSEKIDEQDLIDGQIRDGNFSGHQRTTSPDLDMLAQAAAGTGKSSVPPTADQLRKLFLDPQYVQEMLEAHRVVAESMYKVGCRFYLANNPGGAEADYRLSAEAIARMDTFRLEEERLKTLLRAASSGTVGPEPSPESPPPTLNLHGLFQDAEGGDSRTPSPDAGASARSEGGDNSTPSTAAGASTPSPSKTTPSKRKGNRSTHLVGVPDHSDQDQVNEQQDHKISC